MPTFDAAVVVETLDYKFEPFVKAHGTTPEPTDEMIGQFMADMKTVAGEIADLAGVAVEDASDPIAVLRALDDLDPKVFVGTMDKMSELYGKLCQGKPSAAQLGALPLRARLLYFNWLAEQMLSPEAAAGAGNAQVVTLPRSVAG